jgi:hypothetical protein
LSTQLLCRGFPFAENNCESIPYQFDQVFHDGGLAKHTGQRFFPFQPGIQARRGHWTRRCSGLYGASRQGEKAYLSGPKHQKYRIYRKDAEAAKGRKEDHPWVR